MIKQCTSLLCLITFLVGCSYSEQTPASVTPGHSPLPQTTTRTQLVTSEQTREISTPQNTPASTQTPTAEPSLSPTSTSTISPSPQPTPTFSAKSWRELPVVPLVVSEQMRLVYERGLAAGNNPQAFSKVGDCQSGLPMFLADLDKGRYDLGEHTYLQPVIDNFTGSFWRSSRAVKDGLTASAVNVALWNDWRDCETNETPLACEYRLQKPSFAIISLGTNDANGFVPFEETLRKVIDVTLAQGIVPILATKADNAEGDFTINLTIARLAYEYQIPVWNFWLAVQDLPLQGLRSPEHLTYGEYVLPVDFSSPDVLQYAFNVRNLTALQALDIVWRSVTGQLPSH